MSDNSDDLEGTDHNVRPVANTDKQRDKAATKSILKHPNNIGMSSNQNLHVSNGVTVHQKGRSFVSPTIPAYFS